MNRTPFSAKALFAGLVALSPVSASADTGITAMIPRFLDPEQPVVTLTAPVSTIVSVIFNCVELCVMTPGRVGAVMCDQRGDGRSIVGQTLPAGSYFLTMRHGIGDGTCNGSIRVTP